MAGRPPTTAHGRRGSSHRRSVEFAPIAEEAGEDPASPTLSDDRRRDSAAVSAASSLYDDDDVSLTLDGLTSSHLDRDLGGEPARGRAGRGEGGDELRDPADRPKSAPGTARRPQQDGRRGRFLGRAARSVFSTLTASAVLGSFGYDDREDDRRQDRRHGVRGHDAARFGRDDGGRARATLFRRRTTMASGPGTPGAPPSIPGTPGSPAGDGTGAGHAAGSRSLRDLVSGPPWRGLICLSIGIVIFGPPVQEMALPPPFDLAMDAILTVCMAFLAVDIVIRCASDPSYFHLRRRGTFFGRPGASALGAGGGGGSAVMMGMEENRGNCCRGFLNVHAGSFMFYCDAVGTLSTLYRISYVNPAMRRSVDLVLPLTELGLPAMSYTQLTPIGAHSFGYVDLELLLTVGRVGLMARFIRTSVLVEMSSGFPYRYFYPTYWLRALCRWCVRRGRVATAKRSDGDAVRPDASPPYRGRSEAGPRASFASSTRRRSSTQRTGDPEWQSRTLDREASQRSAILEGDDENASRGSRGGDDEGPAGHRTSLREVIRDRARAAKRVREQKRTRGLGRRRKSNETSSHVGEFFVSTFSLNG